MNKLMKIMMATVFAFFLAACEKPDPKADYQKIIDWNIAQEKSLGEAQVNLQTKLASNDPAQIQAGLSEFNVKVADVIKSLDAIKVDDAQIKTFKEKTKQVLTLSSEVLSQQVKVISTPNDQTVVEETQQKTQALMDAGTELQKLNTELQQRFSTK